MKTFCTFATYEEIGVTINRMRWSGIEPSFTKKVNILEKIYFLIKGLRPMRIRPVYAVVAHATQEQWNKYTNDWNLIPMGKES